MTPDLGLEQLEEWSCCLLSEWLNRIKIGGRPIGDILEKP